MEGLFEDANIIHKYASNFKAEFLYIPPEIVYGLVLCIFSKLIWRVLFCCGTLISYAEAQTIVEGFLMNCICYRFSMVNRYIL